MPDRWAEMAANLASLNEIMTELVQAARDHEWTDPAFAGTVRDTLMGHSHRLGFEFEGIAPVVPEDAGLDEDGDPISCLFCEWDQFDPAWFRRHEGSRRRPYPGWLCGFCCRSHAASRWLAGDTWHGEYEERDRLTIANVLRAEVRATNTAKEPTP